MLTHMFACDVTATGREQRNRKFLSPVRSSYIIDIDMINIIVV